MVISKLYETLYFIGFIIADNPIINNKLNIFEPIIFPIAMSLSPFIAAITLVTSSGKLVPIATIVKPIIFALMCNIGTGISRIDAIVLVFILLAYIVYLSIMAIKGNEFDHEGGPFKFSFRSLHKNFDKKVFKDILFTVIGILGLKFGGDFVVNNAVSVAEYFKLSEKIISVTILAVGTSLPELVTSVSAAIKGKSDIAIGNIIGSNIFNILLIIGMSSLISPITFNISYNIDLVILTIAMLFLSLFPYIPPKNEVSRSNGIAYVIMYVLYLVSIFIW